MTPFLKFGYTGIGEGLCGRTSGLLGKGLISQSMPGYGPDEATRDGPFVAP